MGFRLVWTLNIRQFLAQLAQGLLYHGKLKFTKITAPPAALLRITQTQNDLRSSLPHFSFYHWIVMDQELDERDDLSGLDMMPEKAAECSQYNHFLWIQKPNAPAVQTVCLWGATIRPCIKGGWVWRELKLLVSDKNKLLHNNKSIRLEMTGSLYIFCFLCYW